MISWLVFQMRSEPSKEAERSLGWEGGVVVAVVFAAHLAAWDVEERRSTDEIQSSCS